MQLYMYNVLEYILKEKLYIILADVPIRGAIHRSGETESYIYPLMFPLVLNYMWTHNSDNNSTLVLHGIKQWLTVYNYLQKTNQMSPIHWSLDMLLYHDMVQLQKVYLDLHRLCLLKQSVHPDQDFLHI